MNSIGVDMLKFPQGVDVSLSFALALGSGSREQRSDLRVLDD
jgi:hypothetical protein